MDNVVGFPSGGVSGVEGLPPKEDSSRPSIMITPANYEQEIDQMEWHLIAADRSLYQRDGEIVQAGTIKIKNPDGTEPSYVAPVRVRETTLMEMSTSATTWLQRTEKGWKQVKAPRDHARALLDRGPRLNLPVLSGIIASPLMFADGRLLERRGYDEQSGLLFAETGETFPPVPLNPTEQELEAALFLLWGLMPEFVFAEPAGRSVALSGFLTSCCRAALETAPLHGVTAPQAGTGKSYLQELWGLLATGSKPAFVNLVSGTEGELDKRVTSLLLKGGVPSIAVGNVPRGCPIGSSLINEMLTASQVECRIFQTTTSRTCSTRTFVSASGNNLEMGTDMYRRTIMARLDAEMEHPESRKFKTKPALLLREQRPCYVVAALTLLRGYVAAGRPLQELEPLNGFEDWSELVRSCIVWLGMPDPVETQKELREADAATVELAAVLGAVYAILPKPKEETRFTAKLLAEWAMMIKQGGAQIGGMPDHAYPEVFEMLRNIAPEKTDRTQVNTKALGKWIARNARTIADGMRFVQADIEHKTTVWRIEKV